MLQVTKNSWCIVNGSCIRKKSVLKLRWTISRGVVGMPLTDLSLPLFCACPMPEPGFPTSYVILFHFVQWMKVRRYCRLVDIDRIVVHYCSNFLFIMLSFMAVVIVYIDGGNHWLTWPASSHSQQCNLFKT